MKKRLILSLLLMISLTSIITTNADTTDSTTSVANSSLQSTTVYSNSTTVTTDNATINANNVTINKQGSVINGTILRSINLQRDDTYYRPLIADLKFLKGMTMKNLSMSAVYTGEFDTNPVDSSITSTSREVGILGNDIQLSAEEYDNISKVYTATKITGDVSRSNAIMDMYKAIGKTEYKADLYTSTSGSGNISLQASPLLSIVPRPSDFISGDRYYTDVFVSRTLPDKYWADAIGDGILSVGYNTGFAGSTMTVGEFSLYLANMLDLKGEAVITKEESEMLLVYYGKNLPTYLQANQLEAVKYLIVRGIVDTTTDFSKNLNMDVMLKMLMRAKDKSSRLVFKNIQIPYIKDLVDSGFYPTQTKIMASPMVNASFSIQSASATYDDYFVKVISGKTTFTTASNKPQNNIFVSTIVGDDTNVNVGNQYEGSVYYGIENGYYHFRVPISLYLTSGVTTIGDTNYITLNTPNADDNPKYVKLEEGGGVYNAIDSNQLMARSDFNSDYLSVYIDKERRLVSQSNLVTPAKLASSSIVTATMSFHSSDIASLLWNAAPITNLKATSDNPTPDPMLEDLGGSNYLLTVKASDPYQLILSSITYANANASTKTDVMPAYVNNGKIAMVSLSYLKKNNLLDSVVEVGEDQYLLYGEHSNIYIDKKKKTIVAGSVVTEIADTDPSPLIVKDSITGEYLIDYRAVKGVANGFLILKDTDGNIALSLTDDQVAKYTFKSVFPLLGNDDWMSIRADDLGNVLLEDTYEMSNFLVYKSRKGATSGDYLLVFTPHIAGITSTKAANVKILSSTFGIALDSLHDCNIYRLDQKIIYANNANKTTSAITSSDYGYTYNVPLASAFNYKNYLQGDVVNVLPFVRLGLEGSLIFVDFNVNIMDSSVDGYATYNGNVINPLVAQIINPQLTKWSYNLNSQKVSEVTSYPTTLTFAVTAIAGVQSKYYPFGSYTWKDVMSNVNNYTAKVAYGSMMLTKLEVNQNDSHSYNLLLYDNVTNLKYTVATSVVDNTDKVFRQVFRGTHNAVYVYDSVASSVVTSSVKSSDNVETIWGKGVKSTFDFLSYVWDHKLTTLDDFMTIVILFLLNIVPRIMMFDFLALAALSLVAKYPLTQKFCIKVFDFYKILSLGHNSYDTVKASTMWTSTFIGGVFLGILQGGAILQVFSSFVTFILKIMGR